MKTLSFLKKALPLVLALNAAHATQDISHLLNAIKVGDIATLTATQDAAFKENAAALLEAGLKGDFSSNPALGKHVLQALIDKSIAFLDAKSPEAEKLFHLASAKGCTQMVESLINKGINVNSLSEAGETALHAASLAGEKEVVALLVQHGVNPDLASKLGQTALHLASQEGHKLIVQLLLEWKANINAMCHKGFTALHYAEQRGHDEIVKLLHLHPKTSAPHKPSAGGAASAPAAPTQAASTPRPPATPASLAQAPATPVPAEGPLTPAQEPSPVAAPSDSAGGPAEPAQAPMASGSGA